MKFVAQDLREYMAKLGFKTIDEMVGHTECLHVKEEYKERLDLSKILFNAKVINRRDNRFKEDKPHNLETTLDYRMLLPLCREAVYDGKPKEMDLEISNVNRTFGTILSNEITKIYKETGLKEDTIIIHASGNAGNSFGAFLTAGITITVTGDANDYLGKGLCGGKIAVHPSKEATFDSATNVICGNVALYGATKGECYLEGLAGERFAVRNSGAEVVALGCGQHGCEYMTGGTVLILGDIGRNFAAGMSGGIAYIYGQHNRCNVNTELVSLLNLEKEDIFKVKDMLKKHIYHTQSKLARQILDNFDENNFFKVLPKDYAKIMNYIKEAEASGAQEPLMEAFVRAVGVR